MTYTLVTRLHTGHEYNAGAYADLDMAKMNARLQNATGHMWGGHVIAIADATTGDIIERMPS